MATLSALSTLRYACHEGVATVTLDQGDSNRINTAMLRDLSKLCDHLEDSGEARVVIFRGSGGCFSEGMDFGDFDPNKPLDIHGFNKWEKACTRLERLPVATVSLVDGNAWGGGLQIALVCDLRVATPRSSFRLPEVHMGFLPGMATFRLAKYIGLGHAKRFMMTGAAWEASEALRLGLIDSVEADLDQAEAWALRALGPNHSVAISLTRRLLNESFAFTYEDAIGHFLAAQHRAVSQSAFLDTLRKQLEEE